MALSSDKARNSLWCKCSIAFLMSILTWQLKLINYRIRTLGSLRYKKVCRLISQSQFIVNMLRHSNYMQDIF